jgi:hypothetical protein
LPAPRHPRPRPPAFVPKQSANAGTTGRLVTAGPIFAAPAILASAFFATTSLPRSGASHEVFSPSAHTGRDALSGAGFIPLPAPGRSRFGVLIPVNPRDRCSRTDWTDHRPCGFSPSAEQSGVARTGGRFGLVHAHVTSHTCGVAMMSNSMSARHLIRSCECLRGNRRSRSRGPNHSSASASIRLPSRGHAPSHSLSAVFRYPTAHSEPRSGLRGLAERVVLPSSFGGAHGVHSLRRFTPASGGLTFLPPGPTCRSRLLPAPIYFRRGDCTRPVGFKIKPE